MLGRAGHQGLLRRYRGTLCEQSFQEHEIRDGESQVSR